MNKTRRFDVQHVISGGRYTLVLSGELDLASASQLKATIDQISSASTRGLVLNLTRLTFIDSSGLEAILAARKSCAKRGLEFLLVRGPRQVHRVFELTGTANRLPFEHAQPPYAVNIDTRRKPTRRRGSVADRNPLRAVANNN